ncbi:MAG: nucleoside-diphosphate sugar epimerase/dehydratase [Desulfobacterales bacterium]|nr:nucleoside-diphosphate sugar epimerase/dehydratase [Desulfobacterales bacterium]
MPAVVWSNHRYPQRFLRHEQNPDSMPRIRIYPNLLIIHLLDAGLIALSFYTAHLFRFEFDIDTYFYDRMVSVLPLVILTKMVVFHFFDLYRGMWRYTSINDLINILKASVVSSLILISAVLLMTQFQGFSRSVFLIDACFTILLIGGLRFFIRFYFERFGNGHSHLSFVDILKRFFTSEKSHRNHLLIVGAGNCGEKLYREIRDNAEMGYRVIGFLDDNPVKWGMKIHGLPVLGAIDLLDTVCRKHLIEEIIIAIPSADSGQMRRIVDLCTGSGIKFRTVPSYAELINGSVSVKEIRDIAYPDLLGREVVQLAEDQLRAYLSNDDIMVTGAGGSIGAELCRQVSRFAPRRIVLFERAESPLFDIETELRAHYPQIEVIPVLGDVCDGGLLGDTIKKYRPRTIFHAAAYKHVPILEMQPWKAVDNNIVGTLRLVEAALAYEVNRFVFVSTDKAVRPANVMGASKRVSERLLTCHSECPSLKTKFMIVRFGNVVGSVGSVVPLFKKQIAAGGPVTVTHPEATRFFMTIPEACQLILQAGAMGQGGEIYFLDMGTAVKIDDMARDLIKLSGFEPETEIPIAYTGLRPGEKLHEELITADENLQATPHQKILVLQPQSCDLSALSEAIDALVRISATRESTAIRQKLMEIVPDYKPNAEMKRTAEMADR